MWSIVTRIIVGVLIMAFGLSIFSQNCSEFITLSGACGFLLMALGATLTVSWMENNL